MYKNQLLFLFGATSLFFLSCGSDGGSMGPASSTLPDWCNTPGNCGFFQDTRDGNRYRWTKIGSQTWMAENLAYLPSVNIQRDYSTTAATYHVFHYDGTDVANAKADSNYTTYGVLYNWTAAMAACPTGWHLPSDEEWTTLETTVGGRSTAGTKLKSITGWITEGDTATDSYGFSALPGGYSGNSLSSVGSSGYWWTATERDSLIAKDRNMYYMNASMSSGSGDKGSGYSVRCIQNGM